MAPQITAAYGYSRWPEEAALGMAGRGIAPRQTAVSAEASDGARSYVSVDVAVAVAVEWTRFVAAQLDSRANPSSVAEPGAAL